MIFDADDPNTWNKDFLSLVDAVGEINDESFSQLTSVPECLNDRVAGEIRKKCREVIRSNYQFICGYHACRTAGISSYLQHGILRSSRDNTLQKASVLLNGFVELNDVLRNEDALRFERTNNTVGILFSGQQALKCKVDYLNGSERLRTIAAILGSTAQEVLDKALGDSYLIRFKVPTKWLLEYTLEADPYMYFYDLIAHQVNILRNPDANVYPPYGELHLTKSIPAEFILEATHIDW